MIIVLRFFLIIRKDLFKKLQIANFLIFSSHSYIFPLDFPYIFQFNYYEMIYVFGDEH